MNVYSTCCCGTTVWNINKSFSPQQMTKVEVYLYSLTASGPGTVHLASLLWPWSLGPSFQFVPCLQPFSVWPGYRKRTWLCITKIKIRTVHCFFCAGLIDSDSSSFTNHIITSLSYRISTQLYSSSVSYERAATTDHCFYQLISWVLSWLMEWLFCHKMSVLDQQSKTRTHWVYSVSKSITVWENWFPQMFTIFAKNKKELSKIVCTFLVDQINYLSNNFSSSACTMCNTRALLPFYN